MRARVFKVVCPLIQCFIWNDGLLAAVRLEFKRTSILFPTLSLFIPFFPLWFLHSLYASVQIVWLTCCGYFLTYLHATFLRKRLFNTFSSLIYYNNTLLLLLCLCQFSGLYASMCVAIGGPLPLWFWGENSSC